MAEFATAGLEANDRPEELVQIWGNVLLLMPQCCENVFPGLC